MKFSSRWAPAVLAFTLCSSVFAQAPTRVTYRKIVYRISMRDGVKLYTAVYVPTNRPGKHPILLERTPYSCAPYGESSVPRRFLGGRKLQEDGFIFAFQDVRGKHMSEGDFIDVRPIKPKLNGPKDTDESTDSYDTIDYLVKNVPDNNGRVGVTGISYPGGYAAMASVRTHPAMKGCSPQAPTANWWVGDDDHHHGAFFLQDSVVFFSSGFGLRRPAPAEREPEGIPLGLTRSAYDSFLNLGTLKDLSNNVIKGQIPYWDDVVNHPDYDDFWKARDITTHLFDVKCPTLVVGGFYDAEDMWGALNTFQGMLKMNSKTPTYLAMGPWYHGMWAGPSGKQFGGVDFGTETAKDFKDKIETPFWEATLLEGKTPDLPKASVFDSGSKKWLTYAQWPPKRPAIQTFFLNSDRALSSKKPSAPSGQVAYESDPNKPVPYTEDPTPHRGVNYMIEDQTKLIDRADVAVFQSGLLTQPIVAHGPINADLWISTKATDCDLIVKVIDEIPAESPTEAPRKQLVRVEIMRSRYRDNPSRPSPLATNRPNHVLVPLNDVCHTFLPGHRLIVSVQSSWFPLVDRNPQTYVNIYEADTSAFQKAVIGIETNREYASSISFTTPQGNPKS